MPRPLKDPKLRQRRNRVTSAAILTLDEVPADSVPALPSRRKWQALTLAWWQDVWRSPMRSEFLDSDRHGLFLLAELVDRFWVEPSERLAAEIRMQRQCFGLTPIDRRRLQWEVKRIEAKQTPQPAASARSGDPRSRLHVVS